MSPCDVHGRFVIIKQHRSSSQTNLFNTCSKLKVWYSTALGKNAFNIKTWYIFLFLFFERKYKHCNLLVSKRHYHKGTQYISIAWVASVQSAHLSPIWPWFNSRLRLCEQSCTLVLSYSIGFFCGLFGFPPSKRIKHENRETVNRGPVAQLVQPSGRVQHFRMFQLWKARSKPSFLFPSPSTCYCKTPLFPSI